MTARDGRAGRPAARWLTPLAVAATVAAAYALGAACSWVLFHASSAGAVFFPPAGVTLGALVLAPRRHWVWVLAGAGAVEFGIDVWQGLSPPTACGFVLANVVEPLVGATLVRRFLPGRIDLTRRRDAGVFLSCAVVTGPIAGASIGATMIVLAMHPGWLAAFGQFWAGDALAVLTLGAAIVGAGRLRRGALTPRRAGRGLAVLVATAALTAVGFWSRQVPLIYLPVPLLLAVGFRGQIATVGASGFVMAFTANLMSALGYGPWADLARQPELAAATLQIYLAFVILGAWVLAIAVTERDRAQAESRREIEARRQLQALQDVTAGLATAATSEQMVRVLVQQGVGLVADHGLVALTDRTGDHLRTWPTASVPPAVARRYAQIRLDEPGRVPTADAARTGLPVVLSSAAEMSARYPDVLSTYAETGTRSLLTMPIRVGERCLGALAFGFRTDDAVTPEVTSVAQTLAKLAGQALERAELYEAEHEAAHQLQRSLLPHISPDLPGVEAAVCYRPAERGHDVGGDWYDVFELPGNRVGIAVGDILGHGLKAAIAMGRLQQSLRSVALTGASPVEVLEAMDDACRTVEGADYATVGYAEYSPTDGVLTYACAGHLPPLLVVGGAAEYLDAALSQPLRLRTRARVQAQVAVPAGAMLVWYSDGLVERRRYVIDAGLTRLATIARGLKGGDPRVWCDRLLAGMTAEESITDDIVVACLRLDRLPAIGDDAPVLRLTLSSPEHLVETRRALRAWSAGQHLSTEQTDALLLACNEALSNALEHAYRGRQPGRTTLKVVRVDHRHVRVEVSDGGRWRPGPHGEGDRGRGLMFINRLARRVLLDLSDHGTRVTITLGTVPAAAVPGDTDAASSDAD
jgi:serine phosphatase RsbU (regulator of sigma subunit)/integral membrane sensor domain MASE1/anti-sigma regulatory factor (Ser/Thr protein kinase)